MDNKSTHSFERMYTTVPSMNARTTGHASCAADESSTRAAETSKRRRSQTARCRRDEPNGQLMSSGSPAAVRSLIFIGCFRLLVCAAADSTPCAPEHNSQNLYACYQIHSYRTSTTVSKLWGFPKPTLG